MRASFCLYSDGKFFRAEASGCTGQVFTWGHWKQVQDTVILEYSRQDIFRYDVSKSKDTQNNFQIVQVIDCYHQPVRFQFINHDNGYTPLYNTGMLRIKKGNAINYPAPVFDHKDFDNNYIVSNADTITYQWHCNRECLESINGGDPLTYATERREKVLLRNWSVRRVED